MSRLIVLLILVFVLIAGCINLDNETQCIEDEDCACGTHIETGECFYGNRNYVDINTQCPDFCTGITGSMKIKCINEKCVQIASCNLECEEYSYGNCPDGCIERCVSSGCSGGRCNTDCGGYGSCSCPTETYLTDLCASTGGKILMASCCESVEMFPNTCLDGPCGCSIENSHEVKFCSCEDGKCFDVNSGCH